MTLYVPRPHVMADPEIPEFVRAVGSAALVTVGEDGLPDSTLLPVLWREDLLLAHFARANPHWQRIRPGTPGLAVVTGAQAYISPSFYPSKAEHGRAVPTWNYTAVHLRGVVTVIDDVEWVRAMVTELTDRHEADRAHRWRVSDAPSDYLEGQLRAIVGVQMRITSVEGKAKLSQNRSDADQEGVIAGLGDDPVADAMRADRLRRANGSSAPTR